MGLLDKEFADSNIVIAKVEDVMRVYLDFNRTHFFDVNTEERIEI